MNAVSSSANCFVCRPSKALIAILLLLVATFAVGCGGNGGASSISSTFSGNTNVVLLASSTANDQLSEFSVTLTSLILVDQSGNPVELLHSQVSDDFIHVNGRVEPLATVSVPQGVYTSAQARFISAFPECAGQNSGQLLINEGLGAIQSTNPFAINMPQPITIAGTAMGLVLNLQVTASARFSGPCSSSLTNTVHVTPTFDLTPLSIAEQPTSNANGRMQGLRGIVSSISANGNGFTATTDYSINAGYPANWQIGLSNSTGFQGISNASQLVAGMPVDMDVNIQSDGSLVATRVAVPDTNISTLNTAYGTPLVVFPSGYGSAPPVADALQVGQSGDLSSGQGLYSLDNASFQVSGQFANLQSLPFAPTFSAANMVDGQNVFFSLHGTIHSSPPSPMTTVELIPQTINGTVSAVSNQGNFTTYTVTLASYDLFPNLAVQPGQTTLLTNPNTVVVYADSNTQTLNSNAVSVGGVFRFYGLVFNDNGTLRMDCAQMADGVAE